MGYKLHITVNWADGRETDVPFEPCDSLKELLFVIECAITSTQAKSGPSLASSFVMTIVETSDGC